MKIYEVTYRGRYFFFIHLEDVLEFYGDKIETDPSVYYSGFKARITDG